MKEIILAKCGELVLKGLNRNSFEKTLLKNLKTSLYPLGNFEISIVQSTIYVIPDDCIDIDLVFEKVKRVFGIATVCKSAVCEKDMQLIKQTAREYCCDTLMGVKTFKVAAKRSDKRFALNSPQICYEVGGYLLENYPHLKVDVHNPDVVITVEVRDFGAYIHANAVNGAGGMPYGSNGKACLMLSGGIDSPVAGYMMAKRGLKLTSVHFYSPPYTGELAKQKVLELAEIMNDYCPGMNVHLVHFTKIQEEIKKNCREELFTVIMRRFMVRIANAVSKRTGCGACVTGESLGQVASQTMEALNITDEISNQLILRPLIGMDKEEIVKISRKIGTFETSIQPYEDCCTVFTPKHPKTRPVLSEILIEEQKLDVDGLVQSTLENIEIIRIGE